MIRELTIVEYMCDLCPEVKIEHRFKHDKNKLPEGWTRRTVGGHGMTNYDKDYELCPACKDKAI